MTQLHGNMPSVFGRRLPALRSIEGRTWLTGCWVYWGADGNSITDVHDRAFGVEGDSVWLFQGVIYHKNSAGSLVVSVARTGKLGWGIGKFVEPGIFCCLSDVPLEGERSVLLSAREELTGISEPDITCFGVDGEIINGVEVETMVIVQ